MASVDQRIVELKFEAKQFMTGIQAAIASLDNLKKNLKMDKAANEFSKVEKASKNVKFNDMYQSIDTISNRFSTFGVVATTALVNIANTAVNAGKRMLSSLTEPLIAGGKRRALNIEQAKFQIQGLGYTWEQVESDINYGVQDTAYGLDAAAKAASQLLASQVKVGDEMKRSLRGISGVAAMTSSSYEDIANVFTTVAGNGRVMGDQLMQLSTRGLNAAATLGQYLGKSEAEIREMVSKGKIDFNTFAAAMDSAFGEHAKKANETFTGSLSNMKAALSRIGADFATPAYKNLRDIFNSLTPVINGVKDALQPLVKTATLGMEVATKFVQSILPKTREEMKGKLTPTIERLNKIITNLARVFTNVAYTVKTVFNSIFQAFTKVFGYSLLDMVVNATEVLKNFSEVLNYTGNIRYRMLTNLNKTFQGIFTIVSALVQLLGKLVYFVSSVLFDVFVKVFSFLADFVLVITGHIGEWIVCFKNLVDEIRSLDTVQRIFKKIGDVATFLKSVFDKIYEVVTNLIITLTDKTFTAIGIVFKGLLVVIKNIAVVIDLVVRKVREFIDRILAIPEVQSALTRINNAFVRLVDTVKEASKSLKTTFIKALNKAKEVLGPFISRLKDLIKQYVNLPNLEKVVVKVLDFLVTVIENGTKVFHNLKELLSDIFGRIKELTSVSLSGIIENFGRLKDKIIEVVDASGKLKFLSNMFATVKTGFISAAKSTGDIIGVIKDNIIQLVEWLKTKFASVKLGDVIAAGAAGSAMMMMYQMSRFMKEARLIAGSVTNFLDSIAAVPKGIGKVLKSVSGLIDTKKTQMKMDAIGNLIKSVVLLAGAVALLASMDQEKVRSSAEILLVLAIALVGISTAMAKIEKNVTPDVIAKSTTSLISVAGSLFILCLALKVLADVPMEGIGQRLGVLGVVMLEFAAMTILISRNSKEAVKGTKSILALSIAIFLLVHSLKQIGEIDSNKLFTSIVVIGILSYFLTNISKTAGHARKALIGAKAILAAAIAIMIMIHGVKTLAKMNDRELSRGLGGLSALMILLGLFMKTVSKSGRYAVSAGVSIAFMSIGIAVLAQVIKKLSELKDSEIKQASKTLLAILSMFAIITLFTNYAGEHAAEAGKSILLMSVSMGILAGAMLILGKMRPEEVAQATAAISMIFGMFALVIASTSKIKGAPKTIKLLLVTMLSLAAALAILSLINPENLMAASTAISMLIGVFALLIYVTKFDSSIKKVAPVVGVMIVAVGLIAAIVIAMSNIPWENAIGSSASLSMILLSMTASMLLLSNFYKKGSIGAVMEGVLALSGVIVVLGTLFTGLGALVTYFPDLKRFLEEGIPVMEAIGRAIGGFVGSLVEGVLVNVSNSLPAIGSNLTSFMENIRGFIEISKSIDDSAKSGMEALVGMIGMLTLSSFVDGLNFFGSVENTIDKLKDGLPKLAEAFKEFAKSIAGMDTGSVENTSKAVNIIMDAINNIPISGGFFGLIMGGTDISGFARDLPKFGQGLYDYSYAIAGMDAGSVINTEQAARIIIDLANSIPNTFGGIISLFTGGSFIDDFGKKLPIFAKGFYDYAENISGMDTGSVINTEQAIRTIIDIAGSIPNTFAGVAGLFTGGGFIDDFGERLPIFGKGFYDYANSISGMDTSSVINTEQAIRTIIDLTSIIPNTFAGVAGLFTGGGFIDDFGERLPIFAHGFFMYAQNIGGMDTGSVIGTEKAVRTIIDLAGTIPNTFSGVSGLFTGGGFIDDFGDRLPIFAHGFFMYAQNIAGMDTGSVYNTDGAVRSIIELTKYISDSAGIIDSLLQSLNILDLSSNLPVLAHGFFMYAQNIGGMDVGSVINTDEAVRKILQLSVELSQSGAIVSNMPAISSNIEDFGQKMKSFSDNAVQINFDAVSETISYMYKIGKAMNDFPQDFDSSSLQNFVEIVKGAATDVVKNFVQALKDGSVEAGSAANNMIQFALNMALSRISSFHVIFNRQGQTLAVQLAYGIRERENSVVSTFEIIMSRSVLAVRGRYEAMKSAGEYLCSGLNKGIDNGSVWPIKNVEKMGDDMVQKLRERLGINSPAKEGILIGRFWNMGIALGVIKYASNVIRAVTDTADDMETKMLESFSFSGLDSNIRPVITPELDLSEVDRGLAGLNDRFALGSGIPITTQNMLLSSALSNMSRNELRRMELQNGSSTTINNNYDMTQNNYSPKALSRIDIYRDTRNQFSRLKGVVSK